MTLAERLLSFLFPDTARQAKIRSLDATILLKHAKRAEGSLGTIRSLFAYRDPLVRDLIWELKYGGSMHAATIAAKVLKPHIHQLANKEKEPSQTLLLIPLPAFCGAGKRRSFNQCERIAQQLVTLGIPCPARNDLLIKTRETLQQAKILDAQKRKENVRNCFSISNPQLLKGKNVILLDDVVTTGATLREASQTLLEAGTSTVYPLTLAR